MHGILNLFAAVAATVATHVCFAQGNLDATTVFGSSAQTQTLYLQKRLMEPGSDIKNPAIRHRMEQELSKFEEDPDIAAGLREPSIFSFQAGYTLSRLSQYVGSSEATQYNLGHTFNLGLAFDLAPQWNASIGGSLDSQPTEKYKNGGLSMHLTYSHGLKNIWEWLKYVFTPKREKLGLKPYQRPARSRQWHSRTFVPFEDPMARTEATQALSYPLMSLRFSGYLNQMIKDPSTNLFDGSDTSQSLLAADLGQLSLNQRAYGLGAFISWNESFTFGTTATQYLYNKVPYDYVTSLSSGSLAYDTSVAYGGLNNWYGVLYGQPKRAHSVFMTIVPSQGWQWDTTVGYLVYNLESAGTLLSVGQMLYFPLMEKTRMGLGGDYYKTASSSSMGFNLNVGRSL